LRFGRVGGVAPRVFTSIALAVIYAGVGLAPLVYTYLAAREARSVYEKRVEEAVEEPLVPVHVVVVVREGEEPEVKLQPAPVAIEEVAVEAAGGDAEDATIFALSAAEPRIAPLEIRSVGGADAAVEA